MIYWVFNFVGAWLLVSFAYLSHSFIIIKWAVWPVIVFRALFIFSIVFASIVRLIQGDMDSRF